MGDGARIAIFGIFIGVTIAFLDSILVAVIFFVFSLLSVVEAAMRSFLRHRKFNIRIGSGFKVMKYHGIPSMATDVLCVPVSIRFWGVKNLQAKVSSGDDSTIDTVPLMSNGDIQGEDSFELSWDERTKFLIVGYLQGNNLVIGTPIVSVFLGEEESYPVNLSVMKNYNVICSRDYRIVYKKELQLLDCGVANA